jgi:UDP-MurNAc hydroxylase
MRIRFVGHACVVIETSGTSILMDPWLSGKIFNDSWTLRPQPEFDPTLLESIDYLWISHEHPDHCHFPTLNSFPAAFKQRVIILIQERDHEKLVTAFKELGYRNIRLLPHRSIVPLSKGSSTDEGVKVYCYHAGLMDSALAVIGDGQVALDANDARISSSECRLILKDLGHVDVILNQFSLAAYAGFEPPERHLPVRAHRILQNVSAVHRALKSSVTIPFASFIYFSSEDNKYVNQFTNTVRNAYDHLCRNKQGCVVLYPGDAYEVGSDHDSVEALRRYDELSPLEELPYDPIETKSLVEIFDAYRAMARRIRERYSHLLLALLRPVIVQMPDLARSISFRLSTGVIKEVPWSKSPDLIMNSQPLWFGFKFSFGMQTLGVSARFRLLRGFRNWKMHRILFALNNGGVYLRPKYILNPVFFRYLKTRLAGGVTQAVHYYRTSL